MQFYQTCLMGVLSVTLAACQPVMPDSGFGLGSSSSAGFDPLPAAPSVTQAPLPQAATTPQTTPESEVRPVVDASPLNPTPAPVQTPGISDENDFDAVAARQSIESDRERLAQNRAQYQVVTPTALPTRDDALGPNVVAYALQTTHPVGTQIYRRLTLAADARFARNCAKYASGDNAQADFLARGGPTRDRAGLDPDGDGYACDWDPGPYRRAAGQ